MVAESSSRVADNKRQLDAKIEDIKRLESQLRRINQNKYSILSFQYYLDQNSKLGAEGKITGIKPEKSYEEVLEEKNFDDSNMKWVPELNDYDPCFYYCSGKYQFNMNQIDKIKGDEWHHNRYTKYLNFLLQKETGQQYIPQQTQPQPE